MVEGDCKKREKVLPFRGWWSFSNRNKKGEFLVRGVWCCVSILLSVGVGGWLGDFLVLDSSSTEMTLSDK